MRESRPDPSRDSNRKRRYRNDGTPLWGKQSIDGPGVWVSCVKGKERQTVGELYDLFESLASELWPEATEDIYDGFQEAEGSLEDQISQELAAIKRPRKDQRFANSQTNTPCVVFISCKPPVDPVKLVTTHVQNVKHSGITRTKYTHRLIPVSGSCAANILEIESLCHRIFESFFDVQDPLQKFRYKIDARIRNHTTLSRPTLIQAIAGCVPQGHTVDLGNPEVFVLVEVFKNVCGVSVVKDYYYLQKFNVMEIANETSSAGRFREGEGRVHDKDQ